MRTDSRLAVGSPTVRVTAILAATLLLALALAAAGAGVQRLAAAGPIVVAADGSGDYTTIQEAVDAAAGGDEILVRPGVYAEEVVIEEKAITVRGDGPIDEIVLELDEGALFTLSNSDAEVADLTLRGGLDTQGMNLVGGAPTVRGVVFDGTGVPYESNQLGQGGSLTILGDAQVLDSSFVGGGEILVGLFGNAVLENNELTDGPHIYLQAPGADAVVRNNTIKGTFDRAIGLFGETTMTIENNTIVGAGGDGITVGWNTANDRLINPLITGNDISDSLVGIKVHNGADPVVESNRLSGNETAVINLGAAATYAGNELTGNDIGFSFQGSPTLADNSVVDGGVGLVVYGSDTQPVLTGNTVCGNDTNVQLAEDGETPPLEYDDSNEICEDGAD